MQLTPEESRANEEALQRAVLTLWQTRMLRMSKLSVLDEVENGFEFYDYTFLRELPHLYAGLEDLLASKDARFADTELPSFMRMGSWIGGDRDGNPFVTATVLEKLWMQATRALKFYLDELHTLGSLSMATLLVKVSPELVALAERSPDHSPHRADEPYRLAVSGIYARLAMTLKNLLGLDPVIPCLRHCACLCDCGRLVADLDIIHQSLQANGSGRYYPWPFASLASRRACFRFLLSTDRSTPKFRCTRTRCRRVVTLQRIPSRLFVLERRSAYGNLDWRN